MNRRITTFILAALFALACRAQAAPATDFEYGPRPPLSVFDPTGVLNPELVKKVSDTLAALKKDKSVDIIVVVLKDLGEAPPEHVALQFSHAWCDYPLHCVVLHVPGNPNSPWIIPDGKLVDQVRPEEFERAVIDAERRARAEPKDGDKVKAAATEASDMLRYWLANAFNRSERIITESTAAREEMEKKARQRKIIILGAAAAFIPLVVGISMLTAALKRRGPGYFPNHAWQLRLGAPHAGGNQAVADLGPPLS